MRLVIPILIVLFAVCLEAQPVAREANVVTIDRVLLERYHVASVAEALRLAAGFDTVRTYFKQDVVTTRGILEEHYANDVLLMIDGAPTWLASTGEGNLDRIDVGEIDHIELIRGPGSVRFGTNAYAGAINIVLRHPDSEEAGGRITAGTEGFFGAAAHAAFPLGSWSMVIAGRADDEDGEKVLRTDERNESGLFQELHEARNVTLSARNPHHALLVNAVSGTESFLGSAPEFAQGFGQDHTSRGYLASYRFSHALGSKTDLVYRATYDWNRRNFSRSRDGLTRSNVEGWRLQHDLLVTTHVLPSFRVDVGASVDDRHSDEYTNESIRTGAVLADNNMRDRGVSERSLSGEAEWTHGAWTVNGGTRLTRNGLSGSNVSSQGALDYALTPSSSLHALVRQSYRAPSLFELYFQTATNTVFGNTELAPETSLSFDVGYSGHLGPVTGSVYAYRAEYDDKIVRVRRLPDHPTDRSLIYANGSDFRTHGLELDLHCALGERAQAMLAWTWTDGEASEAVDTSRLRYVPAHLATAGVSLTPWAEIGLSTLLQYRSAVDGPHERIGAQTTIDLAASWTRTFGAVVITHELTVRNVTDDRLAYPEYVRGNLNEVEDVHGRTARYSVLFSWGK